MRRLVELHGGSVLAHSDGPGQGSTFTVRLTAPPQRIDRAPPRVPSRSSRNGTRRVLVVDDSADQVETLGMILTAGGHTVRTARSGAEALEIAAGFAPEVAIVDIGMPDMDGLELARRLKALPGSERRVLIALSGYGEAEARQRALEVGFDEYLVKPVDMDRVLDLIET